jgi:heme/copper-type cytochrome/quinol oxidase subunit 1
MRPLPGKAPGNPYRSLSLEWSMDSPPGTFNFDEIPTITEPVYNYGTKIEEES